MKGLAIRLQIPEFITGKNDKLNLIEIKAFALWKTSLRKQEDKRRLEALIPRKQSKHSRGTVGREGVLLKFVKRSNRIPQQRKYAKKAVKQVPDPAIRNHINMVNMPTCLWEWLKAKIPTTPKADRDVQDNRDSPPWEMKTENGPCSAGESAVVPYDVNCTRIPDTSPTTAERHQNLNINVMTALFMIARYSNNPSYRCVVKPRFPYNGILVGPMEYITRKWESRTWT